MKKLVASPLALVLYAAIASPVALADPTSGTQPQSKEDSAFEAQGSNGVAKLLADLVAAIARNTDGTLSASESIITSMKGDFRQTTVSLETRAFAIREFDQIHDCPRKAQCQYDASAPEWRPGALFVPIEVSVRADTDNLTEAEISDFKVGAVRLMMRKISLTVQALSYEYHKNRIGLGSRDAFEIVNVAFNDVSTLSSAHGIELIVKLTVGVGAGGMYANPARDATSEAIQAVLVGQASADKSPKLSLSSGGSIGVRFSKKFLADVYGGYNSASDKRTVDGDRADGGRLRTYQYAQITELTQGVGLRYEPSKYFNARFSVQEVQYSSSSSLSGLNIGATDDQSATEVSVAVELRW